MLYLVSYDLNDEDKNYPALRDKLIGMEGKKVLASQWIVREDNTTAEELRDLCMEVMDDNDSIFVNSLESADLSYDNLKEGIEAFLIINRFGEVE